MVAEFLDRRIYDESEFAKLIPVEVIAEIPPLPTPEEDDAKRAQFRMEFVAASAMSLVVMLGVAFSFLRG